MYKNFNIKECGNSKLEVRLKEKGASLDEVVVTALGISRQQKALGYSAQEIGLEEFNDARSNNWSSGLSGKVAG